MDEFNTNNYQNGNQAPNSYQPMPPAHSGSIALSITAFITGIVSLVSGFISLIYAFIYAISTEPVDYYDDYEESDSFFGYFFGEVSGFFLMVSIFTLIAAIGFSIAGIIYSAVKTKRKQGIIFGILGAVFSQISFFIIIQTMVLL